MPVARFEFMTTFLSAFDRRFSLLHARSKQFLEAVSDEGLFLRPRALSRTFANFSIGEYVIRSAAIVEQTFGGITTRLWDDPFEWTLPEKLSTTTLVRAYLDEVEETRTRGFAYLKSDDDLRKELPAPERLISIFELLLATLARAEHYQGRAFAAFQMLSDDKLPRI